MLNLGFYSIFVFCSLILSTVDVSAQSTANNRDRELGVMTRNMYLGTEFDAIFAAPDQFSLLLAVGAAYTNVQNSNPAERIAGIADEIEAAGPALVGLQEVALWRTGTFGDPADADTVAFDFLAMLHAELASRGLHYATIATQENLNAEVPALINFAPAFDVRFTDRVVIIARTDLQTSQFKLQSTHAEQFDATFSIPGGLFGGLPIPRGWTSADVKMRGRTYRFVNAHLESFHPLINVMQASELAQNAGNTGNPVIFAGDFNSDAASGEPGYQTIINAGFSDAWPLTNGTAAGRTWPLFLAGNPFIFTPPSQRLDLILIRGQIDALDADVVGEDALLDRTPSGLMRSDHAGVVASLALRP